MHLVTFLEYLGYDYFYASTGVVFAHADLRHINLNLEGNQC